MGNEIEPYVIEGEIVEPCERCGQRGRLVVDPFLADVHNARVGVVLCDACLAACYEDI